MADRKTVPTEGALPVHFTGSFERLEDCPKPKVPEFAFIGRSNVGKSSLINLLCGRKAIAKVSSRPGKTQLMNFFWIDEGWYLVDLPGYGYAKASKTSRKKWQQMIRNYLVRRSSLACVFLLIDGSIPPQDSDLEFAAWLGEQQVPFVLVYTKRDKVAKTKRQAMAKVFEAKMLEQWEELPERFPTSASERQGRDPLLAFIRGVVSGDAEAAKNSGATAQPAPPPKSAPSEQATDDAALHEPSPEDPKENPPAEPAG